MSKEVTLSLNDEYLKVHLPKDSVFFQGMHNMFLANVLGFQPEEETGYVLAATNKNVIPMLMELVEYFKEENAVVTFDRAVGSLINSFTSNLEELEKARQKGLSLKSSHQQINDIPGFKRKLKSYQHGPVAHLVEMGNAANFSVPGSGKTTVTLAAYALLKDKKIVDRILVISPRAAFMAWEEEYEACFGKKANSIRITGSLSLRKKLYRQCKDAELILLSYQMASQDIDRLSNLLKDKNILLVLDESHYIKRIEGGKWANAILSIAPLAKRRVILTGTPVPNSLEDLWSQMTFLWPSAKILGTVEEYKEQLASLENGATTQIKKILHPFYWRIHKSDLRLKKPKYHHISVRMRPYQQAIYDALAAKVLSEVIRQPKDRVRLRMWRNARLLRLLQTSSNPALLTKPGEDFGIPAIDATGLSVAELIENYTSYEKAPKLDAIVTLTNELLKKGEKVLIWTSFIYNIKSLQTMLKEHKPRIVYGEVPKDKTENEAVNREQMIHDFKNSRNFNVLIANPAACAESVSLHKICHNALYLDRTFNASQYMQSLDRIHRIGLLPNEQVHYYFFRSSNSIDEVIEQRLLEKQKRMLELLNDDFGVLDLEASTQEIIDDNEEEADFNAIIEQLKRLY